MHLKIVKNERAGQVPYGWRLAQDGKTLLANAKEQKAILLIKELRAKGYSFRAICQDLEKRGYESAGRAWHPQTVKNILRRAA
ncbi:MAG: Recombinase [Syntrophorhabdaceae bacterium PtaU1.Bin034]|nr:MAG: Recombinase [Syntrophorhabdaceae bacterium PtaU1.Bin034]